MVNGIVGGIVPPTDRPFKLDLGCGNNKVEGHFGVDIAKTDAADLVWDLKVTPWPIPSDTVDEIVCNHFFEHLTGAERIKFMDEVYRILKDGSKITIVVPYWSSMRAIQDPTHQWPPLCEASFVYFNREWREMNKLEHYDIHCDFDYSYGYAFDSDLTVRNLEWQQFAVKHYLQSVNDMQVVLTKRPNK